MSNENTFLNILNEKKEDLEAIKQLIMDNKDLINTEFNINNNSKIITYSPLTYCIDNKLSELSIFLIEQGANINYKTYPDEDYPLLLACKYNLEDVVKKLLLYDNLDINCLNKKNETCYHILLYNKNVTLYNLIIDHVKKKANNDLNNINDNNNNKEKEKEKYNNNKKKTIINNISFTIPFEYKNNYINSQPGKLIILFNIFYL